MISVKVDQENRILIVEMVGMVSEADIEAAAHTLQHEYPGVGVHFKGEGCAVLHPRRLAAPRWLGEGRKDLRHGPEQGRWRRGQEGRGGGR